MAIGRCSFRAAVMAPQAFITLLASVPRMVRMRRVFPPTRWDDQPQLASWPDSTNVFMTEAMVSRTMTSVQP